MNPSHKNQNMQERKKLFLLQHLKRKKGGRKTDPNYQRQQKLRQKDYICCFHFKFLAIQFYLSTLGQHFSPGGSCVRALSHGHRLDPLVCCSVS